MCSTAAAPPRPDAPSRPPRHAAWCSRFLGLGVPQGRFHEPLKGSGASPSLTATGGQLQRRESCWLAAPRCLSPQLPSFLCAHPVSYLNPLHLNSGAQPLPEREGFTCLPRSKQLRSHTCWALTSSVPNPWVGPQWWLGAQMAGKVGNRACEGHMFGRGQCSRAPSMEGVRMVDLLKKHILPRRFWELPETFPKPGNAHVCPAGSSL